MRWAGSGCAEPIDDPLVEAVVEDVDAMFMSAVGAARASERRIETGNSSFF